MNILIRLHSKLVLFCSAMLLVLSGAASAVTYNVNSTADSAFTAVNNANGQITAGPGTGTVTLRSAVAAANSQAGPHTINLPVGTYNLSTSNGGAGLTPNDLVVGSNVNLDTTIQGVSAATTIIHMNVANNDVIETAFDTLTSMADLPMKLTLKNLTVSGGDSGGIFTGGDNGVLRSQTTIDQCIITGNSDASFSGGAIIVTAGDLTVTNSTVSNNSSANASTGQGGGINYSLGNAVGQGSQGTLLVQNTTFTNNTAGVGTGFQAGGAIFIGVVGTAGNSLTVDSCTFSGNQATGGGDGGAIVVNNTNPTLAITRNLFTGNQVTNVNGKGGAIVVNSGATNIAFNRFTATNTAVTAANGNKIRHTTGNPSAVSANQNWWASNTGPVANDVTGAVVSTANWLQLKLSSSPASVSVVGTNSSTLTASFLSDSANNAISVANLTQLIGLPISFAGGALGNTSGAQAAIQAAGTATATFTAGTVSGTSATTAQVDGATATNNVVVTAGPATHLTVAAPASATAGTAFTTMVTAFDQFNNVATGYLGTVHFTKTDAGAGSVLPADYTFTAGDSGVRVFTNGVTFVTLGSQTVTATDTVTGSINGTSANVAVTAGAATHFTVSAPATAQGGTAVSVTVTAKDQFNNTATGYTGTVHFTSSDGAATLPGNYIFLAGDSGVHTFTNAVTFATGGNQTVTATDTGNASINGTSGAVSVSVVSPPTLAQAFGASNVQINGTTSLTFTITNPNLSTALTGVAFTDNLPPGLVVATPNALTNSSNGTATATAGSGTVSLSGASLAAGASATISINVTGTIAGVKSNSTAATSTNAGTGNTANAIVTVVGPPVIIQAFGAASVPLNGSTSLTFTVQNNNPTTTLNGVGFNETLPAGLVIATPNGLLGSAAGGTITAVAGSNTITVTGGTLAASSSFAFSINVTGTAAGTQNATTGAVTSTEGGTGNTASASVAVVAPPLISMSFSPTQVAVGGTSSLTFTIVNPVANTVALTGVGFTDTLPAGLSVANASASIGGGTLTTTAPTSIVLSGAIIAQNSQLQFSVTVTANGSGSFTNTTGAVTSTNGGTGNTTVATLTTNRPPVAGPVPMSRFATQPVKLSVAQVLSLGAVSDPDVGDTVSVTAVGVPVHGTAVLSGGFVFYTPNPGYLLGDFFTYTVSDNHAATATATITVSIVTDNAPTNNITKITKVAGSPAVVDFVGIPGFTYGVQYKLNIGDPAWQDIGPVTMDQFGAAHFTDNGPGSAARTAAASGFYRFIYPAP